MRAMRGDQMTVPATTRAAVLTAWVILALVVLRTVLTFASADQLAQARADEWTSEFTERRTPVLTAIALGVLAAAVLLALVAVFLPRDARWAKVLAVLFTILVVGGTELLVWTPTIRPLLVIDVLLLVLGIAVAMLLNPDQVRRRYGW